MLWKIRCDVVSGISISAIFFTCRGSLWFGSTWGLCNELSFDKPWWSVWWCSQSASSFWLVNQSYPVMDRRNLHEHIQVGEEFLWQYSCLWSPIHPAHSKSSRRFAISEYGILTLAGNERQGIFFMLIKCLGGYIGFLITLNPFYIMLRVGK